MKSIEKRYEEAVRESKKQIDKQMDIAIEAIHEAIRISEKFGVAFYASCSPLGQMYTPESFNEKWGKLDEDYLEDLEIYDTDGGWMHSDIC